MTSWCVSCLIIIMDVAIKFKNMNKGPPCFSILFPLGNYYKMSRIRGIDLL